MADYKVSYKVLKQQGDELKAVAKLVDGYAERVSQISGNLGSDEMLAEIRRNLAKLREQLGESRVALNTAGEFLSATVDSYTGVELRQVKKVDATRAHNRDFYKNPTVVASAGGAAATGAAAVSAAGAASATNTTNINYSDNSVNTTYSASVTKPAAAANVGAAAKARPSNNTQSTPVPAEAAESAPVSAAPTPAASPAASPAAPAPAALSARPAAPAGAASPVSPAAPNPVPGGGMSTGAKAAVGLGGAAAAAGGVVGGLELKKRRSAQKAANQPESVAEDEYDPEAELAKAIARMRELEKDE